MLSSTLCFIPSLLSITMHTHFNDNDWQAAQTRYKETTALPSSLIVPSLSTIRDQINASSSRPQSSPGPTLKQVMEQAAIPADILSKEQSELLVHGDDVDAVEIVKRIKSGQCKVETLIEAHLRMAAIAQQTLGCYSSIFFDKARIRAKELDRRISAGEDCGRLCGLPISIKAHIAYKDTGSDRGFIFDVLDPSSAQRLLDEEESGGANGISKSTLRLLRKQGDHMQTSDAVHVTALLDEGAVIIAKTVMPQSVMQLE